MGFSFTEGIVFILQVAGLASIVIVCGAGVYGIGAFLFSRRWRLRLLRYASLPDWVKGPLLSTLEQAKTPALDKAVIELYDDHHSITRRITNCMAVVDANKLPQDLLLAAVNTRAHPATGSL